MAAIVILLSCAGDPAADRPRHRSRRAEPVPCQAADMPSRSQPGCVRSSACRRCRARDSRSLEYRRSAEHAGSAGYEPARLRQLVKTRPDGLGRRTGVYDDRIGANDPLARTADQSRRHHPPAVDRKNLRRLMSELESNESAALEHSRVSFSFHRTFKQSGIDDPMDLSQRHACDRRSLVRSHEHRLIGGHGRRP